MRIFRRAALALLVAGCAASLSAPNRAVLRVEGAPVTIVAPDGLCIDPGSLEIGRAGGFLLIGDCVTLGAEQPEGTAPLGGVITVSVSTGGLPGSLDELEAFLTGPGVGTLGKSGQPDLVRVLSDRQQDGVLYIKVEDRGPLPLPGASPRFWRAFFEAGGRVVGASVVGFADAGMGDSAAVAALQALAARTRAANS